MSEILNRIDFAGRARFQFYDAFSRPYHFDTGSPKRNFFYVFLWNNARGERKKNPLLLPVSIETVRMATPNHLPQYNNHIVLTEQDSPWENRWELYL